MGSTRELLSDFLLDRAIISVTDRLLINPKHQAATQELNNINDELLMPEKMCLSDRLADVFTDIETEVIRESYSQGIKDAFGLLAMIGLTNISD